MSVAFVYLAGKYGLGFLPPVLFWMLLRRALRDDYDPRSFQKFFVAGMVLTVPMGVAEYALGKVIGTPTSSVAAGLMNGFVLAAIPEEVIRALLLVYWVRRARGFADPKWIIGGSVALAMGQVAVENTAWIYLHTHDVAQQFHIFMTRTLLSVPTLGVCGLVAGVATAWAYGRSENWMRSLGSGLLLAVVVHGIFDSAVFIASGRTILIATVSAMLLGYIPIHARLTALTAAAQPEA